MLKITRRRVAGTVVFELAGRLAGPWVAELERFWRSADAQERGAVCVDLSSVTFIDEGGQELLKTMHHEQVKLLATGCLNRCIVDKIRRSQERQISPEPEERTLDGTD